jgi:integrase
VEAVRRDWARRVGVPVRRGLEPAAQPAVRVGDVHPAGHLVTLLIESGLDVAKVAKRVGHSSPAITLAIYTHATAKGDELAAAVLDFG